uniref:NADH dehydrogenase n=1 Tax=Candidatus Kentrum sp. TUN TaxID=2126343 RepID=A0A451A4C2_9GAMM|nr:MAG: NADH dehydrogenase [Candidatus Kentron sp. TUN]VFK60884.1 MAG: NADH dehydrogenase [Candidatus Kentron sp. TUN]VFK70098.1 MAG: NADH dehydrogenase [Candidatus Kentron sp. TUN]
MKVAILGGTGYLGSYLVDALIANGHEPALLVRSKDSGKIHRAHQCTCISGALDQEEALRRTFSGCEAVIYNVGILREFPQHNITFKSLQYEDACRAMDVAADIGIARFILTSANGVKPDGTPYQRTKYLAEEHLRSSQLSGTVFRPSVIFGDPRGRMEFATRLCEEIIRPPYPAPLFHKGLMSLEAGTFQVAPIHVKNVADIYIKALEDPEAIGKTYSLCGPDALEWRTIIKIIGRAIGRKKWTFPVPAPLMSMVAAIFGNFSVFPITQDQLTMLLEGNIGDSSEIFDRYGVKSISFNEISLSYLRDE